MIEHPSFPNPTIKEALCEIHFRFREGTQWQPALFGKFFHKIENEFPEMEPVTEAGFQLQLSTGRAEFSPPRSRMRYRHGTRPLLIQLSENILTVNMLPDYAGWQQFQEDVRRAWGWAEEVLSPAGITRVGLRYINFIPKQSPDERAGDWLAPNEFISAAALSSLPGYLSRVEVRLDQRQRTVVMVAESHEPSGSNVVLDIDCIAESEPDGSMDLDLMLTALHDRVWTIFAACLTPRYRMLLEGGPP
jgi:uncharacterized protein (TIGR04255 family)